MPAFGIRLDTYDLRTQMYIRRTNKRLKDNSFIRNPFSGKIYQYQEFAVIDIKPIVPNVPIIFIPLLVITSAVFGFGWWSYLCMCFLILSYFWTRHFFFLAFKLGLKKCNYPGSIKLLRDSETIQRLINNGTK